MEGWAASGARRGIEYRYPLLDRRLLEFALGLPPEQFRRGRWNRWLMRHALGAALRGAPPGTSADGPVLPPEICWNRSKADPARIDAALDAFAEALPVLRRELRRRAPARACYVDMPRLLDGLDADRFRAKPRITPIRTYADLLAMLSPESWLDAGSPYTDQLLLNRYFAGRQTLVSSTYNYLLGSARAIRAREGLDAGSAKVLHFNLRIKPWMTDAMLHWLQGDPARGPQPAFGLWYDAYLRCLAREATSVARGGATRGP